MHVFALPRFPADVPVTALLSGLFSMKACASASLATRSGKEPGVHGWPVRCGSVSSVTEWHVTHVTAATFALPVYVESTSAPFDGLRYPSSPRVTLATPPSPSVPTLPATRRSSASIAWQFPQGAAPVHVATSLPLRFET